jgi:acyl-CoA synthetase (AMP-forming)/AMP-acid ligase II
MSEPRERTIYSLIERWGAVSPEAVAILAPGRRPATFGELLAQIRRIAVELAALGFRSDSRIGIALPAGPEMGVMHLGAVSACVSVPLNPDAPRAELTQRIETLGLAAVFVPAGRHDTPAAEAASAARIPVFTVTHSPTAAAGMFDIAGTPVGALGNWQPPRPESPALVLTTSGTTSRPRTVVQTHLNRAVAALRMSEASRVTPNDRYLNIMPMFHTQGLQAELVTPLSAGASVVCAPGFDITRFFDWLDEFQPTVFNAVPAMHQAILRRVADTNRNLKPSSLRMVRSSSAALPLEVRKEMERAYGLRVIVSYAATECSVVAQTPLPPEEDRPGSSGKLIHDQVWIWDVAGNPLPPGSRGEVVSGGPTVISGYEGDPEATARSFVDGRFRTGDEGYIDPAGYLFITGRIKEVINRGGEKISPAEIDDALLRQPGIEQACAFAVQDPKLGEELAAAVVLRPGHSLDETEVRRALAEELGAARTPRRVIEVGELPKNVIGKVDRLRMAEKLGLTWEQLQAPSVPPPPDVSGRNQAYEQMLTSAWKDVLRVGAVSLSDTFIGLGGDSLLAARLLRIAKDRTGLAIPLIDFFDAPTIAAQAALLHRLRAGASGGPG